ncbi:MAG: hypothetical protein Q8N23_20800 [Archangium sp.]|nr:hypothetical protein [Archangium sp.]MDP3573357.1 hypothetical protein [Archangium sp.]
MTSRLTALFLALSLAACGPATEQGPEQPLAAAPVGADTTVPDAGVAPTGDLPCEVAQVLAKHCLSCHGPTPGSGAPDSLVTRADLLEESFRGGTLGARSVERMKDTQFPMPPAYAGPRATAAEIAAVERWVDAGQPAGTCSSTTSATP